MHTRAASRRAAALCALCRCNFQHALVPRELRHQRFHRLQPFRKNFRSPIPEQATAIRISDRQTAATEAGAGGWTREHREQKIMGEVFRRATADDGVQFARASLRSVFRNPLQTRAAVTQAMQPRQGQKWLTHCGFIEALPSLASHRQTVPRGESIFVPEHVGRANRQAAEAAMDAILDNLFRRRMMRVKRAGQGICVRKSSHEIARLAATREHNRTAALLANPGSQLLHM